MARPQAKAEFETGPGGRGRPGGQVPWITYRLGRLGLPGASAVLVLIAVLLAEAAHLVINLVRGEPLEVRFIVDVAIVTVTVATAIIVYSQLIIRKLAASRRALKQMTERLAVAVDGAEQANIAKSQFLANMSHELRTPLNAIIGFSDMIDTQQFGPIGNPRYLDYVKDINKSGHHLLGIINDILDLSKIEAGRANVQDEEEFNLAAVVEATLCMMRPCAEREGVTLEASAEVRGLRLLAVERMVCQILLNLLSNAVKFTPKGGRVVLSAARTVEGGLLVAVADTGLGMAPHEIKIALTPFGQVQNALSRKHTGTGLGLPLAKAMMELHGGTLRVASAPGQGTTVSLLFPPERVVLAAHSAAAPAPDRRERAQRVA
jgi:signal transduction histidine kinase